MRKSKSLAWLGGTLLLAGMAFAIQTNERALKDKDLNKLSRAIGDYVEALNAGSGTMEAEAQVAEEIESLKRKTSKLKVESVLALPADLGQAVWLANEYNRKKAKAGKVETKSIEFGSLFTKKDPLKVTFAIPNGYKPKKSWPFVLAIPRWIKRPKSITARTGPMRNSAMGHRGDSRDA